MPYGLQIVDTPGMPGARGRCKQVSRLSGSCCHGLWHGTLEFVLSEVRIALHRPASKDRHARKVRVHGWWPRFVAVRVARNS